MNLLRHEFSDYDEDQTTNRHEAVCAAIAARFPWLAEECATQVARRAASDARDAELGEWYLEELEAKQEWRRDRAASSREAVRQLSSGMTVRVTIRGHRRLATITKVGRSRVTVAYKIKSGEDRTAVVYARDITIVSSELCSSPQDGDEQ